MHHNQKQNKIIITICHENEAKILTKKRKLNLIT